jgi:hypothetical protein
MARTPFELKGKTVFVAGHGGMVGAALVRRLAQENVELLTVKRSDVDLRDQAAVFGWFAKARPQAVFLAAAKVGGIVANNTLPPSSSTSTVGAKVPKWAWNICIPGGVPKIGLGGMIGSEGWTGLGGITKCESAVAMPEGDSKRGIMNYSQTLRSRRLMGLS